MKVHLSHEDWFSVLIIISGHIGYLEESIPRYKKKKIRPALIKSVEKDIDYINNVMLSIAKQTGIRVRP